MSHPSVDRELLRRCQRRDRRAQNEFHRAHFPYMMSIALRYTNHREQAAEWVNGAFVKVFMNLASFDVDRHLGTWMGSILRNVILDDLRKQARKLTQAEDLDRFASALTTKEDPTAYPELLALIDGELSDLSDVTRKVFVMYAIEGFNHREISEQLAIAEGTSRWHFSEARRALRDLLTSNWMRHGL